MRNKFDGVCFSCGNPVPKGAGFFQKNTVRPDLPAKWLIRCQTCVGKGNSGKESENDH